MIGFTTVNINPVELLYSAHSTKLEKFGNANYDYFLFGKKNNDDFIGRA